MTNKAAIISEMKTLIYTQPTDDAWILAVNECIGMDVRLLNIEYWNKTFDNKEIGTVEELKSPDGLIWNRPDGGIPMVVTDPVPQQITLARFLMLAGIIKLLKEIGELSFATVGHPEEWNRCSVYLNGSKQESVITADALLGTITFYMKDRNGTFITNPKGDEFEIGQISGMVSIVVNKNVQTFF